MYVDVSELRWIAFKAYKLPFNEITSIRGDLKGPPSRVVIESLGITLEFDIISASDRQGLLDNINALVAAAKTPSATVDTTVPVSVETAAVVSSKVAFLSPADEIAEAAEPSDPETGAATATDFENWAHGGSDSGKAPAEQVVMDENPMQQSVKMIQKMVRKSQSQKKAKADQLWKVRPVEISHSANHDEKRIIPIAV